MSSSRQPYCAENFKCYSVFCDPLSMHAIAFFGVTAVTVQQPFEISFCKPRVENANVTCDTSEVCFYTIKWIYLSIFRPKRSFPCKVCTQQSHTELAPPVHYRIAKSQSERRRLLVSTVTKNPDTLAGYPNISLVQNDNTIITRFAAESKLF